jgi:hypothetical protein
VFFLGLHFYLVLVPSTPRLIHLYASVGAWSSKLIIFNNIQTCASNFILFLHCLCVCVCVCVFFSFSLLHFHFISMFVCWCVYAFKCLDSFFLFVFVSLFCLFVWLCRCVYVLICSFFYFFVCCFFTNIIAYLCVWKIFIYKIFETFDNSHKTYQHSIAFHPSICFSHHERKKKWVIEFFLSTLNLKFGHVL